MSLGVEILALLWGPGWVGGQSQVAKESSSPAVRSAAILPSEFSPAWWGPKWVGSQHHPLHLSPASL